MKKIIAFSKLVRLPNLILIALSQYLLRYFILKPLVEVKGFDLLISDLNFFLLSLSIVLIAAAGYAINDYFDVKIDQINKPKQIIVGNVIKRRIVMGAHAVMSTLGCLLGAYVSYSIGNINLVFIHLFAIISLWYYSTNFKYVILGGNLVIALLAGLVPLIIGLFEVPLLNHFLQDSFSQMAKFYDFNFNYIAYWCIGYALFAFIMTLAREIIKDMADMEGDRSFGANTLPIAWGTKIAKTLVIILYISVIAFLIYILFNFVRDEYTIAYFSLLIGIPIIVSGVLLVRAENRSAYLNVSNINKIISTFGILYPLLFSYVLKQYIAQANF